MMFARGLKISLIAILAVAAAPFVLTLGAGLIANALGCQLDEGSIHPCGIFGVDLGYLLYAMALSGLIMFHGLLFGLPFVGGALLLWLVVAGVAAFLRRRHPAN
jgi:hypothetical protein